MQHFSYFKVYDYFYTLPSQTKQNSTLYVAEEEDDLTFLTQLEFLILLSLPPKC